MISFANFDRLEKQTKLNEAPDAENDGENFAALLSAPIEQPPIIFRQTAESKQANLVNIFTANQTPAVITTTTAEISPSAANQQSFVVKPEFFTAKQQFSTVQNQFSATEQQNLAIKTPDLATERQNSTTGNQNLATEHQALPLEQTFFSTEKPSAAVSGEELPTPEKNDSLKNVQTETVEKVRRGKAESLINAAIKAGEIEILTDAKNVVTNDFFSIDYSAETIFPVNEKTEFVNRLPKLLSRVSDIFNKNVLSPKVFGDVSSVDRPPKKQAAETSLNVVLAADAPEKIASIEANAKSANTFANFTETENEAPKAAKKVEARADFSAVSVEKFLAVASPETKSVEATAVAANVEPREIVEQIEPRMLHFLSLDNVEKEKKVMRMRLHPAELGTVKIRLEKDASGKLVADFQTDNEQTREILSESAGQLLDSLRDSGWEVERLEIVCRPFSSTDHSDRKNGSRQPEPVASRNVKTASDDASAAEDESKPKVSHRLLSVRA